MCFDKLSSKTILNVFKKSKRGLSLMELILAMSILIFAVWGVSYLNLTAARVINVSEIQKRLRNEVEFVFREMEKFLSDAVDVDVAITGTAASYVVTLQAETSTGVMRTYEYSFAPGLMPGQFTSELRINPSTVVSKNTLKPYALPIDYIPPKNNIIEESDVLFMRNCISVNLFDTGCSDVRDHTVFALSDDEKILYVSFEAEKKMPDGQVVTVPGLSKAILLRPDS